MSDINNVVMSGRLTKDATSKTLPSGSVCVEFAIANNTGWGEYAKVQFFDVKSFTKQSASIVKYLLKGKPVCVIGSYETEKWVYEGIERKKNVLNARDIVLMNDGNKPEQSTSSGNRAQTAYKQRYLEYEDVVAEEVTVF